MENLLKRQLCISGLVEKKVLIQVFFQATTLPNEYKEGKLQAYRLICAMMTRRQDVLPNSDFLLHFYFVMHLGLTSEDQVKALLEEKNLCKLLSADGIVCIFIFEKAERKQCSATNYCVKLLLCRIPHCTLCSLNFLLTLQLYLVILAKSCCGNTSVSVD